MGVPDSSTRRGVESWVRAVYVWFSQFFNRWPWNRKSGRGLVALVNYTSIPNNYISSNYISIPEMTLVSQKSHDQYHNNYTSILSLKMTGHFVC